LPEKIRLRYSGAVNFVAAIVSLFISFGFVVVIIRRLSIEEFGLWALISALVSYPLMPANIWGYWYPRFVARGTPKSTGTAFVVSLCYLPLALAIYIPASYWLCNFVVGWGFEVAAIFGSLLIILSLMGGIVSNIATTCAPEVPGYSSLVYDVLRLPLAYFFVVMLRLGLSGALLAAFLANVASTIIALMILVKKGLKWDGVDFGLAKRWFKGFSIPLLGVFDGMLINADRILLAGLSNSENPVAYMSVSYSLRNQIVYGRATATGLYARMLRGGSASDVEEITRLYFAITAFMFTSIICLPYPLLSLLNPAYQDAYWVVWIASVYVFIEGFFGIFYSAVSGREKVDLKPEVSISDYIKSKLFKWGFAGLIMHALGLAIGTVFLLTFLSRDLGVVFLASAYPVGWLIGLLAFVPFFYKLMKEVVDFEFPWRDMVPFIVASLCSASCYFALGSHTITVMSFWYDAPILLAHVAIASVVYFAVGYALSPWLRKLVKEVRSFVFTEVLRVELV
jgi:hypothetical protein